MFAAHCFYWLVQILCFFFYRHCCFKDAEYTWRWADQTEFLTLKVTPKMGADHMPNNVMEVLDMLTPDYPEAVICHNDQSNRYQQVVET